MVTSKHNDGWCGESCPACSGTGTAWEDDDVQEIMCLDCGGTGERYERSLDLRPETAK